MSRALLLCLLASAAPGQEASDADRFLALGIRQFGEGNFEEAAFSLDAAILRLAGQPARTNDLVRAYVYQGAAYVGLDHAQAAKGKFREALELDPALRLGAEDFPPKVLKVFEEQLLAATAQAKKRGARKFLIAGGVVAAGGVGVAAAVGGRAPANRPPTASFSFSPERSIVGVTTVTFQASAADPDGDPLTYQWDFADGSRTSEPTARHVFHSEAQFPVTLTVADAKGQLVRVERSFVARTLSGAWRHYTCCANDPPGQPTQLVDYQCTQSGTLFECRAVTPRPFIASWRGSLADPVRVELALVLAGGDGFGCSGEVLPALNCLRCVSSVGQSLTFYRPGPDPYGGQPGCGP